MRLVCTIDSNETHENPYEFSAFLTNQGIDNNCEESPTVKGSTTYRVWVYDEDLFDRARSLYAEYQANPKDSRYHHTYEKTIRAQESKAHAETQQGQQKHAIPRRRRLFSPAPYGPISILILFTVATLFIWAQFQRGTILPPKIPGIVQAPILAPIERTLIYDYPTYFQLRDELFRIYTPKDIEQKEPPLADARQLIQKLRQTPVWMGIYDRVVAYFQKNAENPIDYKGPMFEKISQGEVWRAFTPALLHFDLLHIFFNVLWFILLGNQIEYRIGWLRYLILIILTAIFSNTAQYLVSGPFFLGLSGVVCGMAAFIFARQQVAPWEGYLLHRFTLIFLSIFVIGMFLLQTGFFFAQIFGQYEFSIGIANTAHLVGALVGYLLGRMHLFSLRHK